MRDSCVAAGTRGQHAKSMGPYPHPDGQCLVAPKGLATCCRCLGRSWTLGFMEEGMEKYYVEGEEGARRRVAPAVVNGLLAPDNDQTGLGGPAGCPGQYPTGTNDACRYQCWGKHAEINNVAVIHGRC